MPNYTASHRTKPYFNIHGPDIIISHNGNHCRVHPVMCLCQFRLRLDLACRFLYSGSLSTVPCLQFLCLDFHHGGCRAPVQACCVSCPVATERSLVLLLYSAALWLPLLCYFPLVAVLALVRRFV